MKIAIIGTGYVGLVTGVCLAETGNKVICVDVDNDKITKLNSGIATIYEPGLEAVLLRNLRERRILFTADLESSILDSDIIFLALPTPPGSDGSADLQYILSVAYSLGKVINKYKVIVNKSTVPVGTADKVKAEIQKNYDGDFDIVSNPEFLREGNALEDFMKPDRIVIGTNSEKAKTRMIELYAPFVRQGNPILIMDVRSSELTKYAANSFLALKISFMNEIAHLSERMGADVDMIRQGIGTDERIGKSFLYSGIGYGGSCFPKDVKALIKSATDYGYEFNILKAVDLVNNKQKVYLIEKIRNYYQASLKEKKFAIWGLAFKPNTDDIREAPSLSMIDILLSEGAKITVYDPEAMNSVKQKYGGLITYANNQYDALEDADALIIATEWSEFRNPDFDEIKSLLKFKVIFDGRNLYNVKMISSYGFTYISIGR